MCAELAGKREPIFGLVVELGIGGSMVRAVVVLSALLVGSSAFACAMPHREEVSLAQAMEDIDAPAPTPAPKPTMHTEVVSATPAAASWWSTVTSAVAQTMIPEVSPSNDGSSLVPAAQAK